jgi:hypothetical protein
LERHLILGQRLSPIATSALLIASRLALTAALGCVGSAMRAVQKSLGTEFESVRGIVQLYAGDNEGDWLDNVQQWAREGQARRKSEEG